MEVAQAILAQLGGRKFTVMTGARGLLADRNSLSFKLPRFAGVKINYVKITLDASDTYTVEFGRVFGLKYATISKYSDIYADGLRSLFTRETGLETSLGTMRKSN
jgi:hypothetical protein